MPRTKLIGFAPDMDPTTPGVITDCRNAIPTVRGMKGAPARVSSPVNANLGATCYGAVSLRSTDDSVSLYAGTATKLYKGSASGWTDVSRTVGGNYAVPSGYHWSFAQFGTVALATNDADTLQFLESGGSNFENVTGAPKAAIVETVGQFVFLADTDDGVNADHDRWWCCASGDYTDWVPSVVTECATGRLVSSPGPITGMKRFGSQIIMYKARSMFIGTYVGAPEIWRFEEVPAQIGAVSERAVANIGTDSSPKHIFMGMDDFYIFDGSRPIPIGIGYVRDYVFNALNPTLSRRFMAVHDSRNSCVYFYYATSPPGNEVDETVVYNYKIKRWGRGTGSDTSSSTCAVAFEFVTFGVTYDDLGTLYSTYADLPTAPYDSAFFTEEALIIGEIYATNVGNFNILDGDPSSGYMISGDMGDEEAFSLLTRVRPLFLVAPGTTKVQLVNYYRNNLGESLTTDQTVAYSDGKYDLLRSARWHRIKFDHFGGTPWEMSEFNVYAQPEGTE